MGGGDSGLGAQIARENIHGDVHAGAAGMDQAGADLHQVADQNGLIEADAADVHGDAGLSAPARGAGVAGLVDPLHHGTAMDLAIEVFIGGFRHEPQGDFMWSAGRFW